MHRADGHTRHKLLVSASARTRLGSSLPGLLTASGPLGIAIEVRSDCMAASNGIAFSTLAEAFEELERTSSRKQLTTILADLLRQVDADAIAEVAYLLQGRVAPLYEPVEFGLGERSIEKAVSDAYGLSPDDVRKHYARA